jgi:hypothetical protein
MLKAPNIRYRTVSEENPPIFYHFVMSIQIVCAVHRNYNSY